MLIACLEPNINVLLLIINIFICMHFVLLMLLLIYLQEIWNDLAGYLQVKQHHKGIFHYSALQLNYFKNFFFSGVI